MSRNELPASLISSASSLLPHGVLPEGDHRFWSHSMTDLVAGFLRDGGCSRIAEAGGRSLQLSDVEDVVTRLQAAGVRAGDVVLVQVYNEVTAVAALMGVWLVACCVCPVDPDTPPDVLAMIAREAGLPFVYLGYWVPESRKMTYKARFRPSEALAGGVWRVLPDPS